MLIPDEAPSPAPRAAPRPVTLPSDRGSWGAIPSPAQTWGQPLHAQLCTARSRRAPAACPRPGDPILARRPHPHAARPSSELRGRSRLRRGGSTSGAATGCPAAPRHHGEQEGGERRPPCAAPGPHRHGAGRKAAKPLPVSFPLGPARLPAEPPATAPSHRRHYKGGKQRRKPTSPCPARELEQSAVCLRGTATIKKCVIVPGHGSASTASFRPSACIWASRGRPDPRLARWVRSQLPQRDSTRLCFALRAGALAGGLTEKEELTKQLGARKRL